MAPKKPVQSGSPRQQRGEGPSGSKENLSIWSATVSDSFPSTAPLNANTRADVCVVGGGIAGLSTAYCLARAGQSVVVIEKGSFGHGETSHTTAHLSNDMDSTYGTIERLHGEKGSQLAAQSHTAAIAQIETNVAQEKIDCDFERLDGYLFLGHGDSPKTLKDECVAARRAGLPVELLKQPPFDLKLGECIHFPQQAQFHPLKYLAGLARALSRYQGRMFANTEATEIIGGKGTAEIKTKHNAIISAGAVVVATNTPMNDWVTMHTKQAAYRTYVIGAPVPTDSIPKALFWDTEDPFHYVRLHKIREAGGVRDVLIVGGEDHKTGQAEEIRDRFARLTNWARTHFPGVKEIEFQWSGQVIDSMDGLAFIGRNPGDEKNVYISTGDTGMGMTHGTIAGMLLTDLIMGRENPWATLYDPARKTVSAALTFAKENLNVAGEYAKWITPGEVSDAEEIKPGTGAVVRRGLSKVAVYRDESGQLHERSAACTHLGCVVAWNATEHTWDCPCHGSRFDTSGKVLNGPAQAPLAPATAKSSQ